MKNSLKQILNDTLDNQSDDQIANLFLNIYKIKLYCFNIETYKACYYNEDTQLYENIGKNGLATIIAKKLIPVLQKRLEKEIDKEKEELEKEFDKKKEELEIEFDKKKKTLDDEIKKRRGVIILSGNNNSKYSKSERIKSGKVKLLTTLIKSLGSQPKIKHVAEAVMSKSLSENFFEDLADSCRHTVNFKNGVVNLKTGKFRQRTEKDFVTKCLSYDYNPKRYKEIEKKIKQILKQIFNDSAELLEEQLRFLAYLITGEQYLKKMMFYYGSGDNAKTFSLKIFSNCFPIYYTEIQPETFKAGASQSLCDKQLFRCMRPVRVACCNEFCRDIATERFKLFVDGELNINLLYGYGQNSSIHAKLTATTNNTPNTKSDNGMNTRCLLTELKNVFIDADEIKRERKVSGTKFYVKNPKLIKLFKDEKYKLSLFHILLDYTIGMYSNYYTVADFKNSRETFLNLVKKTSKFEMFIQDKFIMTESDKDRIGKEAFLESYKQYCGLKNLSWQKVLDEIKSAKLTYAPKLRADGKFGAILFLKEKDEDDIFEDDDDKPTETKLSEKRDKDLGLKKENEDLKKQLESMKQQLLELKSKRENDDKEVKALIKKKQHQKRKLQTKETPKLDGLDEKQEENFNFLVKTD